MLEFERSSSELPRDGFEVSPVTSGLRVLIACQEAGASRQSTTTGRRLRDGQMVPVERHALFKARHMDTLEGGVRHRPAHEV